jgi:excisionase family DNA binding protein
LVVITLDELAKSPERAVDLSPDVRAGLLARCAAVLAALAAPVPTAPIATLAPAAPAAEPMWLTIPEVAKRLSLARSYVYQLARRGDLPSVRRGKYVRIPVDGLQDWARISPGLDGRKGRPHDQRRTMRIDVAKPTRGRASNGHGQHPAAKGQAIGLDR